MPTVQPSAPDLANRRMAVGLLLSLLAHALVLSIQFGLRGLQAGGGGPIAVSLAPLPPSSPAPVPAPVLPAPLEPAPALAAAPASPPSSSTSGPGFRLFDPVPMAPPPPPRVATSLPRRRRVVRRPRPAPAVPPATPVIAQRDNPEAAFKLPLADGQAAPEQETAQVAEPAPRVDEVAAVQAREEEQGAIDEEARRLLRLREQKAELKAEQEAEQEAERQALAEAERALRRAQEQRLAEERAVALQDQARAERERTRRLDEAAARERLLAAEREADTRRLQDDQVRQARAREQRLAEEAAAAAALAEEGARNEERARMAAAREAERLDADEAARRLAAERERAARQLAEEARERAQQLARRQEEEERARKQRAEAAQAVQEHLARQQARQAAREEDGRQQARQAAREEDGRQAARASGPASREEGGGVAGLPGNGAGAGGASPTGTIDRGSLASRAHELMRGIDLPGTPPAALRPAQQMAQGRRRVVDTQERDVPLRLYVDSFRQKIERNAAQIRMEVAGGPGRADPLVSVALRSDGSVDDVTIVRSSGRADLDEAVRRIVRLNARYAVFPPNVAVRFDVIEIRRIWSFAESLKLLEEVR